jgi:hypothetical protein
LGEEEKWKLLNYIAYMYEILEKNQ